MSRSQYFVLILALLAALVAVLQFVHANAWPVIVAYWSVLTIKNVFDFLDGGCKRK